jgi:hypothetical protein
MLKSIDILIGLAVVMLAASMAVTVMTGLVNHLINAQGRKLRQGIGDLLRLINPNFDKSVADRIATAILTHPLIRDAEGRLGAVIHREELTKIILELASGSVPGFDEATRLQLKTALAADGIPDPAAVLAQIRSHALELEKTHPDLPNMMRINLAILHSAESSFVGKINGWFDQTMDRVSHRFTMSTRFVTFACGLLLALGLQIDTVALVNRISVDEALRQSMSDEAARIVSESDLKTAQATDAFSSVVNQGYLTIPDYPKDLGRLADIRRLIGILLTSLLLSLGAPFWYGALNQLLQLRSKIAREDDSQRQRRQSEGSGEPESLLTPGSKSAAA